MTVGVLRKFGFKRNWIYEIIVTTTSSDGSVNSAPMGVWTSDLKSVKIKVYKKSKTLENILETAVFLVSFPEDVELFHKTLSSKKLSYVKTKKGRSIKGLNYIELKVTGRKKLKDAFEFKASVISHKINHKFSLYNRAEALTLEYLIKKTKPKVKRKELLEIKRVVNKVAPKSIYSKIVK